MPFVQQRMVDRRGLRVNLSVRAKSALRYSSMESIWDIVRDIPAPRRVIRKEAMALAYPLLGAMDYLLVYGPVLRGMYGAATYRHMTRRYPDQIRDQVRGLVAALENANG